MKRLSILFTLTACLNMQMQAQIENEISTYVDSTEIIMNNGRKLMARAVQDKDYDKIGEIYIYLESLAGKLDMHAFNYTEELYIQTISRNWNVWLDRAKQYDSFLFKDTYPNQFELARILYAKILDEMDKLEESLAVAELNTNDKELIALYLHLLVQKQPDEEYSRSLKELKKVYTAEDPLYPFLTSYLPGPKFYGAWNFHIGGGGVFPTGNLADRFNPGGSVYMGMDFNIQKVYASLYMNGGFPSLKEAVVLNTEQGLEAFDKNEQFSYFEAGVLGGYFLLRGPRFQVAPYASFAGYSIESMRYSTVDEELDVRVSGGVAMGPGVHTEVLLWKFSDMKTYYNQPGYLSVKVDAGYTFLTGAETDAYSGNMAYVRAALVLGIGDF